MKRSMGLILTLALAASLTACGGKADDAKTTAGGGKGKLVVAVDPTYPPMESEGKSGVEGFDVDFAKQLGKELGRDVEFKAMEWKGIIGGLTSKRYDVIISSMNITDDRKKEMDFVQYIEMTQVFVGKKGGTAYKTTKDLENKIVAVQADTTSHEWIGAQQKAGLKLKDVKGYGGATDAFAALKAGQADLIVIDEPVGKYYAKQEPNTFVVTGNAMAAEPVGIAVRKDDSALKGEIEKAVAKMKSDGFTKKLSEQYFGSELGK